MARLTEKQIIECETSKFMKALTRLISRNKPCFKINRFESGNEFTYKIKLLDTTEINE